VFELLDELRQPIRACYGGRMQAVLQEQTQLAGTADGDADIL
jgi:hypothetical protein